MPALGSTVLRFESLTSTNDMARELAIAGADEGTAVIASEQTAGRGRLGRQWSSPPGEGLYLSVILRPHTSPAKAALITLAAAVAVVETLSIDFDITTDIKWPNDVLASSRKICGILVESAVESDRLHYAVLGIGVNVNQKSFPAELEDAATSMLLESGRPVLIDELLSKLFHRLDQWYRVSLQKAAEVISRWEQLSSYARGRAVRIEGQGSTVSGVTAGLAASGALLLRLSSGETREIIAGEVTLRKE